MVQGANYGAVPLRDAQTIVPMLPVRSRAPRHVVVATADASLREALTRELRLLRWSVREASGAAEMFLLLEQVLPAAVLVDDWLPDLEVVECLDELQAQYGGLEVFSMDGRQQTVASRRISPLRGELMHALREAKRWVEGRGSCSDKRSPEARVPHAAALAAPQGTGLMYETDQLPAVDMAALYAEARQESRPEARLRHVSERLPEFVGEDARMLEVSRRIRLVAHRKTAVLIHGPSGTGKELVARACHRLSGRPADRFIAVNCAAIPEALVEAELFGHSKGAFTGAVQTRVGLLEAANGGTVFLDEIGELPLTAQSKLLRFLESGELQRVGENRPVTVEVRVVAATHRKLGAMAAEGSFRLDLLQRLSVFLIETPPLAGRPADIDALLDHCLERLSVEEPRKRLSAPARAKLHAHGWPGNVRELQHTLERAWILAGPSALIDEACVEFGEGLH